MCKELWHMTVYCVYKKQRTETILNTNQICQNLSIGDYTAESHHTRGYSLDCSKLSRGRSSHCRLSHRTPSDRRLFLSRLYYRSVRSSLRCSPTAGYLEGHLDYVTY